MNNKYEELQSMSFNDVKPVFDDIFSGMDNLSLQKVYESLVNRLGDNSIVDDESYDKGYEEGYEEADRNSESDQEDAYDNGVEDGQETFRKAVNALEEELNSSLANLRNEV